MNSKGFKCGKSQFSILLQNRVYTGKVLVKATLDEEEKWVEGLHEQFVSTEMFDQVQDILAGRRQKSNRVKIQQLDDNLPLRGLLLCSNCSNKLTGSDREVMRTLLFSCMCVLKRVEGKEYLRLGMDGRESNPHSLNGNRILSPACLPVPPPEHTQTKDRTILKNKKLSQKREFWSRRPGSNRPPRPWQGRALPNELLLLVFQYFTIGRAKVKIFLFLQNFQTNF